MFVPSVYRLVSPAASQDFKHDRTYFRMVLEIRQSLSSWRQFQALPLPAISLIPAHL